MVSYVDIIAPCHSVAILCEIYVMRNYEAHANYGTWSIDFGHSKQRKECNTY